VVQDAPVQRVKEAVGGIAYHPLPATLVNLIHKDGCINEFKYCSTHSECIDRVLYLYVCLYVAICVRKRAVRLASDIHDIGVYWIYV